MQTCHLPKWYSTTKGCCEHPDHDRIRLVQGSARSLPIGDGAADLIITSPPYWKKREYEDDGGAIPDQIGQESTPEEYLSSLLDCTAEMSRVLKPTGSLWVNLGDSYAGDGVEGVPAKSLLGLPWRYAIGCIDRLGLTLRSEVVWLKPTGLPSSVTDRVRRNHEQWFHFAKDSPYYADLDGIREPYATTPDEWAGKNRTTVTEAVVQNSSAHGTLRALVDGEPTPARQNPKGKIPGSVWTIPSEQIRPPEHLRVQHFAAFPSEWPRRLISAWCPPDGLVVDPFAGTGTTLMVARALDRRAIGVELSADYLRLAEWRIFESGHVDRREKAVAKREDVERRVTKLRGRIKSLEAEMLRQGMLVPEWE